MTKFFFSSAALYLLLLALWLLLNKHFAFTNLPSNNLVLLFLAVYGCSHYLSAPRGFSRSKSIWLLLLALLYAGMSALIAYVAWPQAASPQQLLMALGLPAVILFLLMAGKQL